MGLFDKKYCDVCGEKIGLLGNRKLDNGNLCKDCARKLSPFFNERRSSTVAQIKDQLAYREQNKQQLSSFNPTRIFGNHTKVYVDATQNKFIVCSSSNWRSENPDIIDFSQVISCSTDIVENKDEIYTEDKDGNSVSYNPPRYEVEYEFNIVIQVNSPWFSEIEVELSSGQRPDNRFTDLYRELERQLYDLDALLTNKAPASANTNMWATNTPTAPTAPVAPVSPVQPSTLPWICSNCGTQNTSNFCQGCGTPKPQQSAGFRCTNCGYTQPGNSAPAFCPHCGTRTGV